MDPWDGVGCLSLAQRGSNALEGMATWRHQAEHSLLLEGHVTERVLAGEVEVLGEVAAIAKAPPVAHR